MTGKEADSIDHFRSMLITYAYVCRCRRSSGRARREKTFFQLQFLDIRLTQGGFEHIRLDPPVRLTIPALFTPYFR